MAHSQVSAAVIHGRSDTQRTPQPSMTNVSSRCDRRSRPASPAMAPASTG